MRWFPELSPDLYSALFGSFLLYESRFHCLQACSFTFFVLPRLLPLNRELHCLAQPSPNLSWANANYLQDCGVPSFQQGNSNFFAASYQSVDCPCPLYLSFLTKMTLAPNGDTSQVESQFYTAPLLYAGQKRTLHASCRLASSIRGRRLQYFGWSARLQDFTLFFTTWRDMKPVGKVLCATGIVAGLLAFFWKDPFNPGRLTRGVIPNWNISHVREEVEFPNSDWWSHSCA